MDHNRNSKASRRIPEKGWLNTAREARYKEVTMKRFLEQNPPNLEMEALLRTIDFDLIRSLLVPHAVRSGIDADKMNFVYPADIFAVKPQPDNSGAYIPATNVILLPFEKYKKIAAERESDTRSIMTKAIIHEEIHASALVACEGGNPFTLQFQAGYSKYKSFGRKLYEGINEGVVEELCVRTLRENSILLGVENKYSTYLGNRMFISILMRTLSANTGMPQEIVWNGFVRGLYEGLDLDTEPELLAAFKRFIGSASVKALRTETEISPERLNELYELYVKEMDQQNISRGLLVRLKQLFRSE